MNRPNLLLLGIDSLRADAVHGSHVATPNIDSLSRNGACFTQCVATSTVTSPSFAAILTGCYPPQNGVRSLIGNRLSSSIETLAECFSAGGYETHAEATGPLLPETGVLRGFDDVRHRDGYGGTFFEWRDPLVSRIAAYREPWLLFLHVFEVHSPFRCPPDFRDGWDRNAYEKVVTATDKWLIPLFEALPDNTIVVVTGDHGETYPETSAERRLQATGKWIRNNLHTIHWFPYLDRLLLNVTLGHGFSLDEDLIRVPLIISGPHMPCARVDQQVRHVDIFPTVAELCGLDAPAEIEGRSLIPLLNGKPIPTVPAYMEVGRRREGRGTFAVRTEHWKLVQKRDLKPVMYRVNGIYLGDGKPRKDKVPDAYQVEKDIASLLKRELDRVMSLSPEVASAMTKDEEAMVEDHLRNLGYLE